MNGCKWQNWQIDATTEPICATQIGIAPDLDEAQLTRTVCDDTAFDKHGFTKPVRVLPTSTKNIKKPMPS